MSSSAGSFSRQRDRLAAVAREAAVPPSSRCRPPRGCRGRSASSASYAAEAVPCRRRSGSGPGNGPPSSSTLAIAPLHDLAHCGEVVGIRARASGFGRRSLGCLGSGSDLAPRSGTSGTRSSSSARLRTRPSTPRSRSPGSSRCRSIRCAGERRQAEHGPQRFERIEMRGRVLVEARPVRRARHSAWPVRPALACRRAAARGS